MIGNNTLRDELLGEIKRVRDEVMPPYLEIGTAGVFAVMSMRAALDAASIAMIDGDAVGMLRAYQSLKEFST